MKNDFDAKDIKTQAEEVKDSAKNAQQLATQLKNKYKNANDSLTEKAITSEDARARAQQLLTRASKITVATTGKLKELQGKLLIIFNVFHKIKTNFNKLYLLCRYGRKL